MFKKKLCKNNFSGYVFLTSCGKYRNFQKETGTLKIRYTLKNEENKVPILCQLDKLFKTSLYSLFYKGVWERKTNFCPRQTGLELSLLWTTRENDANPLVPMFLLVPVFENLEDMDGQPFARWHCYKTHKQSRMARSKKFEPYVVPYRSHSLPSQKLYLIFQSCVYFPSST